MKSKKIDFTESYDDLLKIMPLGVLLFKLDIPSAAEFTGEIDDTHTGTFCDDCEYRKENCKCNCFGRYMPEYDDGADYED